MNYIWEITLKLAQQNIKKEDTFFFQSPVYSPYYEQAFTAMNTKEIDHTSIPINSFYRFEEIFSALLGPDLIGYETFKQYLFDLLIHYLIEIDLRQGLSKRAFYTHKVKRDVSEGLYGENAKFYFKFFNQHQQVILSEFILYQFEAGTSILLFSKVIRAIFPKAIVYKNNSVLGQLLVYIGEKKDEKQEALIQFMTETFLPLNFTIRLFWEHHFGILDVAETLELGDIEIF